MGRTQRASGPRGFACGTATAGALSVHQPTLVRRRNGERHCVRCAAHADVPRPAAPGSGPLRVRRAASPTHCVGDKSVRLSSRHPRVSGTLWPRSATAATSNAAEPPQGAVARCRARGHRRRRCALPRARASRTSRLCRTQRRGFATRANLTHRASGGRCDGGLRPVRLPTGAGCRRRRSRHRCGGPRGASRAEPEGGVATRRGDA